MNELAHKIHRRKNLLTSDWVLVSPHRGNRPWSGAQESETVKDLHSFDANCPLCPGNRRANGSVNPDYANTYTFINDFSALDDGSSCEANAALVIPDEKSDALFQSHKAEGESRVICFSPDHNKTLPDLSSQEILAVVQAWIKNQHELALKYNWVQIFENKGEIMGCSQPHPHGQIWAHHHLSSYIEKENESQIDYYKKHNKNLLIEYLREELEKKERIVCENTHWVALVPFWAAWPFETLLLPKQQVARLTSLNEVQQQDLAEILKELTIRYDNIFNCHFPYSMGWHGAPSNSDDLTAWQVHAHFYPPLLRSAKVKKFMVGYEMLAEAQRDITPEAAAKILRETSTILYRINNIA